MVSVKTPSSTAQTNGNTMNNRGQSNMSFASKAAMTNRHQNSNGTGSAFRTDSAISGNRFGQERQLQPFKFDDSVPDTSLESSTNRSSEPWDQFAANEAKFGLKTNYDENIYTTTIDRSDPKVRQRYADADRIAREIERSTTTNRHVAEERIRDNVGKVDDSGLDEEDKYSGVIREKDFPALGGGVRADKYTPPARRAPTGNATVRGAPVDPAIISSQVARPDYLKAASKQSSASNKVEKPQQQSLAKPVASKPVSTPPTTTGSSSAATPEQKPTPKDTPAEASKADSPQAKPFANATSNIEREVTNAFKSFAAKERTQADRARLNKARLDKETKLTELRAFAQSFKLKSPLPTDLVAIIAKDPAKQRAIQENAKRQAEEVQQETAAKAAAASQVASPATPADSKASQRANASPATAGPTVAARHTPNRAPNAPLGQYNSQVGRPHHQVRPGTQSNHTYTGPQPPLSQRMRAIEQSKIGVYPPNHGPENRQVPTGPSAAVDMASRRTSTASAAKLNPNSLDFRPNAFAATFLPGGRASATSTPGLYSAQGPPACESRSGLLIKRKPGQPSSKKDAKPARSIMDRMSSEEPPAGKDWKKFGGLRPPFDTLPVWRQVKDNEPEDSTMNITYAKLFETKRSAVLSPPQPMAVPFTAPAAMQQQLPFHLQQGAHMPRPSPRAPQMHMQNSHNMGHNQSFNGHDEHRMMPSQSAQSFASPSFASPRPPQAQMMYPSPMGQPAQLVMQQPMQYMGPGGPQMQFNRSYSGGGQPFMPQPSQMGGPVMMAGPNGPYYGPQSMMTPGMIYPNGMPVPFQQQPGAPPMPMPGINGFPSPGRGGAPMMMQQGSQQGSQQGFPMSPAMQFGQPMYPQQAPPHMQPPMQGFQHQGRPQNFGQSPMPHFQQPHHNGGRPNFRNNHNGHFNGNHHNGGGPNQHQGQHQNHNGQPAPAQQPSNAPTGPKSSPETDTAK